MTYYNTTRFLLSPVPEKHEEVVKFYPTGLQTLSKHNVRLDSGVDLPVPETITIEPGRMAMVNLGVRAVCLRVAGPPVPPMQPLVEPKRNAIYENIAWGYQLIPRSCFAKTSLMFANCVGIIDVGYRGPLIVAVRNISTAAYTIKAGTSLFQIVSADLAPAEYEVVTQDDPRTAMHFGEGKTVRGTGNFGSTGAAGSAASGTAVDDSVADASAANNSAADGSVANNSAASGTGTAGSAADDSVADDSVADGSAADN